MHRTHLRITHLILVVGIICTGAACQPGPTEISPESTIVDQADPARTFPSETARLTSTPAPFRQAVTFTTADGVVLAGTLFGTGDLAVLLAHMGADNADQTSWHVFAEQLAEQGMTALAFDFRGIGSSGGWMDYGELDQDLMAALRFLRERGHQRVVCMGASMGGTACSRLAVDDHLAGLATLGSTMLLGGGTDIGVTREELARLEIPKLYITTEDDNYMVVDHTKRMYELAAEPKALHLFPGSAHGTDIFLTNSGNDLTSMLLDFLSGVADSPDHGTSSERSLLGYEVMIHGPSYDSPVKEAALTMPVDATPAQHTFEGRLELVNEATQGAMSVVRGDPDQEGEVSHLPEFDFELVQTEDGYLIPVQRGLIIADHPYWNYIIEPGRTWYESGDRGYSRASFPFALVWKGSNATLNGTMTFLFNEQGCSKVWYQVTQETTISLGVDMWGLLDSVYHPYAVENAAWVRESYAGELADRVPVKPIEQLAMDYPGLDVSAFGKGVSPHSMTWYGFIVNGVNYVGGCQTRYGEYPYCDHMRVPSYSTAKSAFVSVALMRLAQKYDPEVKDLLIKDFVPEYRDSPGDWSEVTFDDALDMATGNYDSAGVMVDEEQWGNPFWTADYYDDMIAAAFDWPHQTPAGARWVYRTSDTFILTRALQNYLVSKEGQQADIYDFVVDEVFKPLKMGPGVFTTLRTKDDDWQGEPYGGLGMWWIPDDLAKISNFLTLQGGMIDGEQILQPDSLAAALQRDPNDRGVDRGGYRKYNNAFWADRYAESQGYSCEFWVPQMLGYSGIVVVFFPNGTTYYYASDGRDFTWDAALWEADKIIPHCGSVTG